MLSHHEQRCLAEIEHELEHDPTLAELAHRLASVEPLTRRRPRGRIAWWVGLMLELGALGWIATALATGSQGAVIAGLLVAVLIGIPVVGMATARLLDRHRGR